MFLTINYIISPNLDEDMECIQREDIVPLHIAEFMREGEDFTSISDMIFNKYKKSTMRNTKSYLQDIYEVNEDFYNEGGTKEVFKELITPYLDWYLAYHFTTEDEGDIKEGWEEEKKGIVHSLWTLVFNFSPTLDELYQFRICLH